VVDSVAARGGSSTRARSGAARARSGGARAFWLRARILAARALYIPLAAQ